MGIPRDATVVTAEAFSGLSLVIETRWGWSPPINPNRGFVQGSVSGPGQAKRAQSQILALRAVSKAHYLTRVVRFMLLGSSMTQSTTERVRQTSRPFFVNSPSEAWLPVFAFPGQSLQRLPAIGTKRC